MREEGGASPAQPSVEAHPDEAFVKWAHPDEAGMYVGRLVSERGALSCWTAGEAEKILMMVPVILRMINKE